MKNAAKQLHPLTLELQSQHAVEADFLSLLDPYPGRRAYRTNNLFLIYDAFFQSLLITID